MQAQVSHSRMEYISATSYYFSMSLKIHIRELRKAKGLTLAQLADKIGISTPHMSEVERGLKNLNNHLITRLSAALDVPPEALLSGDTPASTVRLSAVLSQLGPDEQARVAAFAEALLQSQKA